MFSIHKDKTKEWTPIDFKDVNIKDMNVAVIGGTNGIGQAISRKLVQNGAKVTVVGRTLRENEETSRKVHFIETSDLGLMKEANRISTELIGINKKTPFTHVIFTTGILASPNREETKEGIERDMATSYLNRFVILNHLAPSLKQSFNLEITDHDNNIRSEISLKPRVFIMGFPGNQSLGDPDNLNSLETPYNAMKAHYNTVGANEALVLNSTKENQNVSTFGLNPGIIQTGIRSNYMGQGWMSSMVEWVISKTTQDVNTYANKVVPLLWAPELEKYNGSMFNNNGEFILPSKGMDEQLVDKFIKNSKILVDLAKQNESK
ncbi:hypothetical protein MOSE0_K07228 [Monosporozyma servazzii]